ncbi:MAG TPA: DinB family protein [Spongiibacteraceae bacterium]|nr:DinB family protein [Spongiibacteraceae bacterium]
MNLSTHVGLMASYNEWMNTQLYAAAAQLSPQALTENRGAFFGSIIGTLNHLVVSDTMWLKRFALQLTDNPILQPVRELPAPDALNEILFTDLEQLAGRRRLLDKVLCELAQNLDETTLNGTLCYKNTKGVEATRNLFSVLMHVFNHQTHHRGQTTTLLSQAGVDVGITDLIVRIPAE